MTCEEAKTILVKYLREQGKLSEDSTIWCTIQNPTNRAKDLAFVFEEKEKE